MNLSNTDYTTSGTSYSTTGLCYSYTCSCSSKTTDIETLLSILDSLSQVPFDSLSEATRKQLESTICLVNLKISNYLNGAPCL